MFYFLNPTCFLKHEHIIKHAFLEESGHAGSILGYKLNIIYVCTYIGCALLV